MLRVASGPGVVGAFAAPPPPVSSAGARLECRRRAAHPRALQGPRGLARRGWAVQGVKGRRGSRQRDPDLSRILVSVLYSSLGCGGSPEGAVSGCGSGSCARAPVVSVSGFRFRLGVGRGRRWGPPASRTLGARVRPTGGGGARRRGSSNHVPLAGLRPLASAVRRMGAARSARAWTCCAEGGWNAVARDCVAGTSHGSWLSFEASPGPG